MPERAGQKACLVHEGLVFRFHCTPVHLTAAVAAVGHRLEGSLQSTGGSLYALEMQQHMLMQVSHGCMLVAGVTMPLASRQGRAGQGKWGVGLAGSPGSGTQCQSASSCQCPAPC